MLKPARDEVLEHHHEIDSDAVREMEWEAVKLSLSNLRTFPWIAEREKARKLKLHGAHFAIAEGILYVLDEAEGTFRPA
jgi:carbonic anhydrase